MFLGEYNHTIDDKGRLVIPAKFRNALAGGMVITKGIDRCLAIYPMDVWQSFRERIAALPTTDRTARNFRRLVFGNAVDVVPDSQGRFVVPRALREYAGLGEEVVIVGCDTYLEVWNPQEWARVQEEIAQEGNAERWAALGI
ncbi:MAG: division/cell wall cluster transcriptional repressor MraZ [Anaerolineae bacterium]|nr:division/cell wall cluster transcriptional repressor MraZ [Anaerolineae bacterium]MDW7990648.1 division/cell wall cluster transcriptional repressor MraZ [Anaerolineae bacterium]